MPDPIDELLIPGLGHENTDGKFVSVELVHDQFQELGREVA